jgi:nucleoside phosphorylase
VPTESAARNVVVLAPMPLEMQAIVRAFELRPSGDDPGAEWTGEVGGSHVRALHIGMGPPLTRAALLRHFDRAIAQNAAVDHVMIAGICGGLDPDVEVGTLVNPEFVIAHSTGATYRHSPPGDAPRTGKLITTEEVTLDIDLSKQFLAQGCLGVDMETSAVAEVCEARGCPWSVYRCIGDRWVDQLLDPRIIALTNQDGSGNTAEIRRLVAQEPEIGEKLERLTRETALAARLAAEAAVRGCLALDTSER